MAHVPLQRAGVLGDVQRGQQRPLLVARGTGTPLLAGESHKHLVVAIGAANPRESVLQLPALVKRCYAAVDHGQPESVLGLIALIVGLPERVEM
jgi:hypothetical protein